MTDTDHTERADLLAELAVARAALINTTRGLDDENAAGHPTVSALSLGGVIKHVASVEEAWLRFVVDGPAAMRYDLPDGVTWSDMASGTARAIPQWAIDHENNSRMQPGETLAGIIEHYQRVAARSEDVVGNLTDLSATHPLPNAPWNEPGAVHSVRWVLIHLISETAQHAGQADIIRESLDGQTSMTLTNV